MTIPQKRLLHILAVSAVALGLSACGPSGESHTAGEKIDSALDKTEQAADNAKTDVEHVIDAEDDLGLSAKVNAILLADTEVSDLQVHINTQDGAVTLQGKALNQAAKDRATELIKAVEGVHAVDNQLLVSAP